MIDIHSHILMGVDDGSKSIEDSLNLLKKAENAGVTDIILTPHYIEGYYDNNKEAISEKIKELKNAVYSENIVISIHQGNEVFLTENSPALVQNGIISTLANSRYVLFEVPFTSRILNLEEIICNFQENGYIPVLAHPERYAFIQKKPESLIDILKNGALAQSNYGSFAGYYGKEVKNTAEILLENKLIHFLGSDTHRHGQIYENIDKILKRLESISNDSKYIYELTTSNPKHILNDLDLYFDIPEKLKEKKKMFFFI